MATVVLMYCKECGSMFENDNATVCLNCGVKKGNGKKHCDECGTEKKSENQDVCLNCGKDFKRLFGNVAPTTSGDKTKLVTLLLWFFLGGLGIHCFYVGNKNRGFLYLGLLAATFITCGIAGIVPGILLLIDLVNILTNKFVDGNGNAITQWT